jgi:hypothetical protein
MGPLLLFEKTFAEPVFWFYIHRIRILILPSVFDDNKIEKFYADKKNQYIHQKLVCSLS